MRNVIAGLLVMGSLVTGVSTAGAEAASSAEGDHFGGWTSTFHDAQSEGSWSAIGSTRVTYQLEGTLSNQADSACYYVRFVIVDDLIIKIYRSEKVCEVGSRPVKLTGVRTFQHGGALISICRDTDQDCTQVASLP